MIAGLWSFDGSCHGATTIQATLIQYSKCVFIFIHNYNFDSSQKPQKRKAWTILVHASPDPDQDRCCSVFVSTWQIMSSGGAL